ncbi:MAG: type IIL restriction-modification enzyme MmeI, partial [Bifidobacterium choerinum]
EYAAIWGTKSQVPQQIARNCDGTAVRGISTLLEPQGRATGAPSRLEENRDIAFIGCYVLGEGFIISPEQAAQWIAADPRNSEVVFPYLNGKDMTSRPDCSPSRWVVDFNDRSEKSASEYALPYAHIREFVKPERQRKKADGTYQLRKPLPERWWQYARQRPGMRKAIANLDEVLCIVRVSKTVMPVRVPTTSVFSDSLVVYATDSFIDQAVLSSAPHQLWAISRGSTLDTRFRYTPSDVFETFPRPKENDDLDRIGRVLDEERREIMLRRGLGLTDLYNLVNNPDIPDASDPDVARMRAIHKELDETVMAAYGWDDIELGHGFYEYRKMTRWTVCPAARVEILDRLLEENQRRAGVRQVQDSDVKEQQG